MLGTRFTDMHSGMRAYTRACLESLPFLRYSEGFAFDAELLVDAVTSGQRVVEVPIPTRYTEESSSISILRSLAYVWRGITYAGDAQPSAVAAGNATCRAGVDRGSHQSRGPLERCAMRLVRQRADAPAIPGNDRPETCRSRSSDARPRRWGPRRHPRVSPLRAPLLGADPRGPTRSWLVTRRSSTRSTCPRRSSGASSSDGCPSGWTATTCRAGGCSRSAPTSGCSSPSRSERGWDASGIEPSAWAVEQGRERFGVDLRQGAIETLEVEPGSVDALVMLDVLEHLADPAEALRRLRPMMADEGVFALATVNVEGLHGRLRGGDWPWFIRSHLHYFRPATLVKMLSDAGFEAVEWSVVPRSFHVSYLLHRAAGVLPGSRLAEAAVRLGDPKVPVGWIGDVTLTIARPR